MKNFMKKEGGFTLIELLVVILIIGILIAVAAPSFLGQTQKARISEQKQELAVAYRATKAGAVTDEQDGTFSGMDIDAALTESEGAAFALLFTADDDPATSETVVLTHDAAAGVQCVVTFTSTTGPVYSNGAAHDVDNPDCG